LVIKEEGRNNVLKLSGIDLAWNSEKNTTAVSFGNLNGNSLQLTKIYPALLGLENIKSVIQSEDELYGIAIDASLIINNLDRQRFCERELSSNYASRGISCHASNLSLYPNSTGVALSLYLKDRGFGHLQTSAKYKFQIECYPHPAIIEIFGLTYRLPYKKGRVEDKKQGQILLARYIKTLEKSKVISLRVSSEDSQHLSEQYIRSLVGKTLKANEDVLDSIICLYIAALFTIFPAQVIYGSIENGYIYVPKQKCINKI